MPASFALADLFDLCINCAEADRFRHDALQRMQEFLQPDAFAVISEAEPTVAHILREEQSAIPNDPKRAMEAINKIAVIALEREAAARQKQAEEDAARQADEEARAAAEAAAKAAPPPEPPAPEGEQQAEAQEEPAQADAAKRDEIIDAEHQSEDEAKSEASEQPAADPDAPPAQQ